MIVDLNRQSLDRVVPGHPRSAASRACSRRPAGRPSRRSTAAGSRSAFARPGRRGAPRADRRHGERGLPGPHPPARARSCASGCSRAPPGADRDDLAPERRATSRTTTCRALIGDLGGHDQVELERALDAADAETGPARPSIFAYTIKGWRLPFAGDSLNHSAHLVADQVDAARARPRRRPRRRRGPASRPTRRRAGCARRRADRARLRRAARADRRRPQRARRSPMPDVRIAAATSTQQAFGDTLAALARDPEIGGADRDRRARRRGLDQPRRLDQPGRRLLAGRPAPIADDVKRPLVWEPGRPAAHRARHQRDEPVPVAQPVRAHRASCSASGWRPIGTVYDPFIARGLDALIYALYVKSRFVLVGTPSGVTLAPEGGAHQSTVTPSLGIELPGLRGYEPVFAREVAWTLLEGIRGCLDPDDGFATYLRLADAADRPVARGTRSRRASGVDGWRDARCSPAATGCIEAAEARRAAAARQPGRPGRRRRARSSPRPSRRSGPCIARRSPPTSSSSPRPSGWPPASTAAGSTRCAAAGATTSATSGRSSRPASAARRS